MKKFLKVLPLILLIIVFSCSDAGNDSSDVTTDDNPTEDTSTDDSTSEDTTNDDSTTDDSTSDDSESDGNTSDDSTSEDTAVAVTGVTFTESTIEIGETKTTQLEWNVLPSDADNKNVTFSSENSNIATVDEIGLMAGVAIGTTTIEVKTEDGDFTDTVEVTVVPYTAIESLEIEPHDNVSTVSQSTRQGFEVKITPDDATNKEYTVEFNDNSLAEVVSKDGRDFDVYFRETGSLKITVISKDDNTVKDSIDITIETDDTKPELEQLIIFNENQLFIAFSELMNSTDVETIANYSLQTRSGVAIQSIDNVTTSDSYNTQLYLNLDANLTEGDNVDITVTSVKDQAGNVIEDTDLGDDEDSIPENQDSAVYYPYSPEGVDFTKIEETNGKISLVTGAVATYDGWHDYQVFAVPHGEFLSPDLIVGVVNIESDGSSDGYIQTDFSSSSDKIFDNGKYDLYVSAKYDDSDPDTDDPMTINVADVVIYEVTTGN